MRINPESLRTIRTDREVRLTDLAKQVGCNPSHLTNVEAGRREASTALIKKLATALNVNLMALLGPEDREESKAAS